MNTYDLGDRVVVEGSFTVNDIAADPTATTLTVHEPDGTETVYTYGVGATVVRDSAGEFHANLDPDLVGLWQYRWVGTGAAAAASRNEFRVRAKWSDA